MTVLTNAEVKKLSFIKKVDAEGNVALVACPSDFKVGTAANVSDLTVTGNLIVSGSVYGVNSGGLYGGIVTGQSFVTGTYRAWNMDGSQYPAWGNVQRSTDGDIYVSFVAPPSGTAFLQASFMVLDNTSTDYNMYMRFSTSDSSAFTNPTHEVFFNDEGAFPIEHRHHLQFYIDGLTPGTTYTYYPWVQVTGGSGVSQYISWGGTYGPFVLTAITIPGNVNILT